MLNMLYRAKHMLTQITQVIFVFYFLFFFGKLINIYNKYCHRPTVFSYLLSEPSSLPLDATPSSCPSFATLQTHAGSEKSCLCARAACSSTGTCTLFSDPTPWINQVFLIHFD